MKQNLLVCILGVFLTTLLPMATEASYQEEMLARGLPTINSVDETDVLPGCFRMSKVITLPQEENLNYEGLGELKLSGSAQFSERGLDALVKRIGHKHITILNVRQEDGGFVEPIEGSGATAFSLIMPMPWWTGEDPRGNRSVADIETSEDELMSDIMQKKIFTIFGTSDSYAPTDTHKLLYRINIAVKRAFTEKQLAEEKGFGYYRIPDRKFGNMEDEHVDMFVEFVKGLPADEWVHVHCKKGQSRTTLFMVMYDMMRNAERVSASKIIKRHGPLGLGGADLYGLPEKQAWDHSFKQGWKQFLYQFHEYIKANKSSNFEKSWTVWACENNIPKPAPVVLGDYYKFTTVESALPDSDEEQETTLVLNTANEAKLRVQNFRSTQDLWLDKTVAFNTTGLNEMRASASNQYSQVGITLLIEKIKKRAPKVVVVDLRHDDHLFVNGLNVSSFESKEALLEPRSPEQIKASVQALKQMILARKGIVVHGIDTKYPKNDFDDRFNLLVAPDIVETPEELVTRLGAEYLLIGTKRFSDASDDDIDRFIDYTRQMSSDTWYHFHCKKGKSRTTLFMTLFDMMQNAGKVSMEDIVKRQRVIGGSDLLDITPKDPSWPEEKESKKHWVVFLARFHKYAQDNKATGFAKSWSAWSMENVDYQPNVDHLVVDKTGL